MSGEQGITARPRVVCGRSETCNGEQHANLLEPWHLVPCAAGGRFVARLRRSDLEHRRRRFGRRCERIGLWQWVGGWLGGQFGKRLREWVEQRFELRRRQLPKLQ